jgi:hypothetical protein
MYEDFSSQKGSRISNTKLGYTTNKLPLKTNLHSDQKKEQIALVRSVSGNTR